MLRRSLLSSLVIALAFFAFSSTVGIKSTSAMGSIDSMMAQQHLMNSTGGLRVNKGYVAGQGLVMRNGCPIWVEFDEEGGVKEEIGSCEYLDASLMAGDTFRAWYKKYDEVKKDYAGFALQVLTREDYESASFKTSDAKAVTKPELKQETYTVVVREDGYLYGTVNENPILLETPLNLNHYDSISTSDQSVLLDENKAIIYRSASNIGYLTAFYTPQDGSLSFSEQNDRTLGLDYLSGYDKEKHKLWGAFENVKVANTMSSYFTTTDDKGFYFLKYWVPPCPCYSCDINYTNIIWTELRYHNFNPKSQKGVGLYFAGLNMPESCFNTLNANLDFNIAIDMAMLTGMAGIQNPSAPVQIVETGETSYSYRSVYYKEADASGTPKTELSLAKLYENYDFNGDGAKDIVEVKTYPLEGDDSKVVNREVQVWFGSKFDEEGSLRSPDLTRLVDHVPDLEDQGLLKTITAEDLMDTDIYVYRLSNNQLVCSREGLAKGTGEQNGYQDGGVDAANQKIYYKLPMRGPGNNNMFGNNRNFYHNNLSGWQDANNINIELRGASADHLRVGEPVKVILINRATGYMGTGTATVGAGIGDALTGEEAMAFEESNTNLFSFSTEPIVMGPPNLKVRAERTWMTSGQQAGEKKTLVGFEGAGLATDKEVKITVEWLDRDGSPLPDDLPGFTGRFAKVVEPGKLQAVLGNPGQEAEVEANSKKGGGYIAQFGIQPGLHTEILQIPNKTDLSLDTAHYYLHVCGEPMERNPSFEEIGTGVIEDENQDENGAGMKNLTGRPAKYVPMLIPVYDEGVTLTAQFARNVALADADADENLSETVNPVHRWVYRPEMQFSLLEDYFAMDGKAPEPEAVSKDDPEAVPYLQTAGTWRNILYTLLQDELDALPGFDPEKTLIFSIGGQEIEAVVNRQEVPKKGETLPPVEATYALNFPSTMDVSKLFSPEDFLTVRLYMNGDDSNVLWEYKGVHIGIFDSDPQKTKCRIMPGNTMTLIARTRPGTVEDELGEGKTDTSDKVLWNIVKADRGVTVTGETLKNGNYKLLSATDSRRGWVVVRATLLGDDYNTADGVAPFTETAIRVGCPGCTDCDRPGKGFVALSSVDTRISLGRVDGGAPAGDLLLKTDVLSTGVVTPKSLSVATLVEGVDQILDAEGVLRQVVAPETFVDIVPYEDKSGYDVRFFRPGEATWNAEKQIYEAVGQPFTLWRVKNPFPSAEKMTRLNITEINGGVETPYTYVQEKLGDLNETWSLIEADGAKVTEKFEEKMNDLETAITTAVKDHENKLAAKEKELWKTFAWGDEVIESISDPDGFSLKRIKAYYTEKSSPGYGRLKQVENADGSWTRYAYDDDGRITGTASAHLDADKNASDATVKSVARGYTPVTLLDSNAEEDNHRPREVRETVEGKLVSKSYHAYIVDEASGERTEITERCESGGASFGDAANLRTVRVLHPVKLGEITSGRTRQVTHPDGRMETYAYETTDDGGLKTTVIHGTETFPGGIAGKTTREVSIEDHLGRTTRTETHIRTADGYQLIAWSENELDDDGHVIKTTNSSGTITEAAWGCCDRDSFTDATGTTTDYLYDDLDRMTSATREGLKGGITTSYTFDAKGRRLTETTTSGGLSLKTENHYDTAGRMDYTIGPDGLTTSYDYSTDGLTTTVTRPGGATEITTRFKDGRIKSVTGTAAPARYYSYGVEDDGSQWTKVSLGEEDGPMWETSWADRLGRTVKAEKPGFAGIETTRHYYDGKGRIVRSETTGMADTLYVYNEAGEAFRTGLDVDGNGELILASGDRISESETLAKEVDGAWWQESTQVVYAEEGSDAQTTVSTSSNRITGLSEALASESVSIDIHGNKIISKTAIDRANDTVIQTVDTPFSTIDQVSVSRYGLVVSSTSATGLTTILDYDVLGRRTDVTDPRTGTAMTHYNEKGRVDWVEDAAGNKQKFAYDPATGMKVSETNALEKTTRTAYNIKGQVTHTWGDATYPVAYTYDAEGRMETMTTYRTEEGWNGDNFPVSATGDVTTWHYDDATGLLTAKEDAKGKSTAYTYTSGGKLHTRTWARSNQSLVTTYVYDDATGELKTIDYSDTTPDITFAYDRLGRQKGVSDAMGNRTFAYNEFLALESETTTGLVNKTLTRTYDGKGRSSGFALGAGYEITYGFDENGRFKTLDWNAGGHADTVTYNRVDNSELIGGYFTGKGFAATYEFEPKRNLKTKVENTWDVGVVSDYTYAYDEIGRRSSVKNSGAAFAEAAFTKWDYNDRNEVTESHRYKGTDLEELSTPVDPETRIFAYDPIGNRTNATEGGLQPQQVIKNYVTNEVNQYESITENTVPESLAYDADGNMTAWDGNTLEWNGENRLVAFYPSSPAEGDMKFAFAYDYMGRRVKKVTQVYTAGAWGDETTTLFVYDGWNLVAETDGVGVTQKSYVWGLDLSQSLQGAGGVGGLVAEVMAGEVYYLAYDANGNVGQLVDGSGSIAARYEYDAFGKEIVAEGEAAGENAFRFSTKYGDEMGLVYYGYRYYVGELGRWGSRDPIGERGGVNVYGFNHNAGNMLIDLFGLVYSATIGLPNEHGEATMAILLERDESCLELYVDGELKWDMSNVNDFERNYEYFWEYPFDFKWLNKFGVGTVQLKTSVGNYIRRYRPVRNRWSKRSSKVSWGFVENMGVHISHAIADGDYITFNTYGDKELAWSKQIAVWSSSIVVTAGWRFNSEAGTGHGYLYDAESVYGRDTSKSQKNDYTTDEVEIIQEDRRPWGRGGGRIFIETISQTIAEYEYDKVYGKWFTLNDTDSLPHLLEMKGMLGVSTGHGGGNGVRRGFSWELPGAPK